MRRKHFYVVTYDISDIVTRREDWVNIYPLCSECFARIEYIPPVKKKEPVKIAVV